MSKMFTQGYADPKGILVRGQIMDDGIIAEGSTVPTAGTAGYEEGALFFLRSGAAGFGLYTNVGSSSSCLFQPIMSSVGVVQLTAALTISPALHSGKTLAINNATGFAITLPAFTGTGNVYHFFIQTTVTSGSHTIVATGAFLFGNITIGTDSAFQAGTLFTVGQADGHAGATTVTMDGSTRGGIKGDWLEIRDIATNVGAIRGQFLGSGTEATPFS